MLMDETPRIQKEIPFVMFDVWNLFFVVFIYGSSLFDMGSQKETNVFILV